MVKFGHELFLGGGGGGNDYEQYIRLIHEQF